MLSGGFLRRFGASFTPTTAVASSTRNLLSKPKTAILSPLSSFNRCLCEAKLTNTYEETTRNIPKYQLQAIDKFFLVVTGTMKRGEIPNEVSYEIVEKSQNRRRIMVNILTIFLTIFGSAYAINRGRKARDHKTEDNVFEMNVKRYERLREKDNLAKLDNKDI
ncbi:uncharacterized protein LOC116303895 [Actinia tenebrosa]|uniref:Uncharacterized protein LOC116303895 n=1 Tax=Actinia tenebrosa TaxID=6105 RepID=A0A6P8IQZ9_ACTTE|nr:uncharacterized protein LOC116303895 [Actinia tenebrosa]